MNKVVVNGWVAALAVMGGGTAWATNGHVLHGVDR